MDIFPCPRSCLRISSRETVSAFPSRVSLLISILRLNLVLTYGIPPEFRGGVHYFFKNRHTPAGQSRVYRVTQLRTDGVHCRESAGTRHVKLKVVPNECCHFAGHHGPMKIRLSFPRPNILLVEVGMLKVYQVANTYFFTGSALKIVNSRTQYIGNWGNGK